MYGKSCLGPGVRTEEGGGCCPQGRKYLDARHRNPPTRSTEPLGIEGGSGPFHLGHKGRCHIKLIKGISRSGPLPTGQYIVGSVFGFTFPGTQSRSPWGRGSLSGLVLGLQVDVRVESILLGEGARR